MDATIWLPFVIRPALSLLTTTFFQPDEFFQSLEPAHRQAFGYGHLTWEWVLDAPIRSYCYPEVFELVYTFLRVAGLDNGPALIWAPKILQGLIAALCDVSTGLLASQVLGPKYVPAAIFLSLTSFFNALSLSRTLSNSVETSLTALALYLWPLSCSHPSRKETVRAISVAAIACLARPTNVIIWIILAANLIIFRRFKVYDFVATALPVGLLAVYALFRTDSRFYGHLTFTPLNFLKTNLSSVSLFYGDNSWHYYLSQGLPVLCSTALPFAVHGWFYSARGRSGSAAHTLSLLVLMQIAVYSLSGHKEWRFLHPILPILIIFASKTLVDSFERKPSGPRALRIRRSHLYLLLLSLPLSVYVMRFHGQGQISVMHYLKGLPSSELKSVGFIMPCHSTPWQAYLHRPQLESGRLWALGCEPPLDGQDIKTYEDQTRHFYRSPVRYLQTYFPSNVSPEFPPSPHPTTIPGTRSSDFKVDIWDHAWPSHLVMFEALLNDFGDDQREAGGTQPSVLEFLEGMGYREVWTSGWNGWEGDEKRRGEIKVWRWNI